MNDIDPTAVQTISKSELTGMWYITLINGRCQTLSSSDGQQLLDCLRDAGRHFVPFSQLAIGETCQVMLRGKLTSVRKIESGGWGGNHYNARRLDGRQGRVSIDIQRYVEAQNNSTY
jgi:hypothetical protein